MVREIKQEGILLLALLAGVLAVFLVAHRTTADIEERNKDELRDSMQVILEGVADHVSSAGRRQLEMIETVVEDQHFRQGLLQTLANFETRLSTNNDSILESFLNILAGHRDVFEVSFINKKHVVLATNLAKKEGTLFFSDPVPNFLEAVFSGSARISLPLYMYTESDPVFPDGSIPKQRYLVLGVPVKNNAGEIVAAVIVKSFAYTLFHLFEDVRLGESGEAYAVNDKGEMLSSSRFTDSIKRLIGVSQNKVQKLIVRDPGFNIEEQPYRVVELTADNPLTKSAQAIAEHQTGYDLDGYPDYRGVQVVGFWSWHPELDFGIVIELDKDEAYSTFYRTKQAIVYFSYFIALLLCLLFFVFSRFRQNLSHQLITTRLAGKKLEEMNRDLIIEKFRALNYLEWSEAIVIELDRLGNIVLANSKATGIFGYSKDELIGKDFFTTLCDEAVGPELLEEYVLDIEQGKLMIDTYIVKQINKNGGYVYIEWHNDLVYDNKHQVSGIRCSGKDFTQHKRYEEELVLAKKLAEEQSRAKSDFLSSMSHELRTPMNAIVGYSQLLFRDKTAPPQYREMSRKIESSAQHLLGLINDVLELSAIESGSVTMNIDTISVAQSFRSVYEMMSQLAKDRKVNLKFRVPRGDDLFVKTDEGRLRQILVNLINNGIKYNKTNGEVVVSAREKAGKIYIDVADTGKGISKDKLGSLFKSFERLGEERGTIEGTGIGLAITNKLVGMLDGKIKVKSEVGQGSVFTVSLPAGVAADYRKIETTEQGARLGNAEFELLQQFKHILVAEDNKVNQDVLDIQLKTLGLNAYFADNGAEALELLEDLQIDLILTDLHMPVMDGIELARAVRSSTKAAIKNIPIIALTADISQREQKRCLEAGMNSHITKPVKLEHLQKAMVTSLLQGNAGATDDEQDLKRPVGEVSNRNDVIDLEAMKEFVGDDMVLIRRILQGFIEPTRQILEEIQDGVNMKVGEQVRKTAHKLKSSARSIGATEMADLCQTLEDAGGIEDWEFIVNNYPRLDGYFEDIKEFVGRL